MTVECQWIVFQTSALRLKALMGQLPQRRQMYGECHLIVRLTQGRLSIGLFQNPSKNIETEASEQRSSVPRCSVINRSGAKSSF